MVDNMARVCNGKTYTVKWHNNDKTYDLNLDDREYKGTYKENYNGSPNGGQSIGKSNGSWRS